VAPYAPNAQTLRADNWVFHDTHTFSPGLLNELRLGYDRDNSLVGVTDSTNSPISARLSGSAHSPDAEHLR